MNLMSLKDYAKRHNVTYEAVRQQVNRYQDKLEDHIVKQGRQQFLDEWAVQFLDEHRARNPVVIYQASQGEEIQRLQEQNEQLLLKVAAQADELSGLYKWQADHALAVAGAAQTQLLLEGTRAELERVKEEAAAKDAEAARARQEAAEVALAAQDAADRAAALQEQLDAERAAREAVEADVRALKGRGLLARILRRGE